MHLVNCARPLEPLENAPRSALLADTADMPAGDQWDGFWSGQSDDYFVRRISADGAVEWFRVEDETASPRVAEARVMELRPRNARRVSLIVAQSPDGRRMLVGSARRTHR